MGRKQIKLIQTARMKDRWGHYRQITRDSKGRIIKNVKWKTEKKMFRVTVCCNYVIHHNYYAYRVTAWSRNVGKLRSKKDEMEQKCRDGAEKEMKYTIEEMEESGALIYMGFEGFEKNNKIQVKYEKSREDTETETNELVSKKKVKE